MSSFGFQLVQKGAKVSFEPRTLEKEVINSFYTLFANKACCTLGISEPGNTAIKTEVPHGRDLLKTRNGKVGRYPSSHMLVSDRGVSNKSRTIPRSILRNLLPHSCFPP